MMRNFVYLNHAGTSWPKPTVVVEAVQRAMAASPVEWPTLFAEAHKAVCQFFGVANQDQLLLTPGCTSALATAITYADIPDNSRVLTSNWEHHALYAPLLKLRDRQIAVDNIPHDEVCPLDLHRLERELKKGDVRLVAVTAACNVTGELLPINETIELANRYDSMVLIDAAQVAGWVELHLDNLNADFVAFGGHKAMQAPWGIGGLYVADSARMKCVASTCEIPKQINVGSADSNPNGVSLRPEYCDVGSVDQFSLAGLAAAVEWLSHLERQDRLSIARQQTKRIVSCLESLPRVRIYGGTDISKRLPTVAFEVIGMSSSKVAAQLQQQGIAASSGFQCSSLSHETLGTANRGLVRLSVGVSQQDTEIETSLEILGGVM